MGREASAAQREKQEQSIKARKSELFVEEEVEYGPRKKLRDYIKETPAAPLSKNVKLILGGSAAPVILLFVIALLTRRSHFKPPEDSILPLHTPPTAVASQSGNAPPAVGVKAESPGPGATANSSKPQDKGKEQAKAKAKKKKPKAKPKPKDDTAVAQNTEGDSAKSEKPKDGDEGDQASAEKPKGKGTAKGKGKSTTPAKPRKQAPPILAKKPKVYNPAYPPRTATGEKKAEPDSDSGIP